MIDLSPYLTPRQLEIVELVCKGWTSQAIADRMSISKRTVESILGSAFAQLQVKNRVELIAVASGLVPLHVFVPTNRIMKEKRLILLVAQMRSLGWLPYQMAAFLGMPEWEVRAIDIRMEMFLLRLQSRVVTN